MWLFSCCSTRSRILAHRKFFFVLNEYICILRIKHSSFAIVLFLLLCCSCRCSYRIWLQCIIFVCFIILIYVFLLSTPHTSNIYFSNHNQSTNIFGTLFAMWIDWCGVLLCSVCAFFHGVVKISILANNKFYFQTSTFKMPAQYMKQSELINTLVEKTGLKRKEARTALVAIRYFFTIYTQQRHRFVFLSCFLV